MSMFSWTKQVTDKNNVHFHIIHVIHKFYIKSQFLVYLGLKDQNLFRELMQNKQLTMILMVKLMLIGIIEWEEH